MQKAKFCFFNISAPDYLIFKILVPTPHNLQVIVRGKEKNFEDKMLQSLDMTKLAICVFAPPFTPLNVEKEKKLEMAVFFKIPSGM